MSQAAIEAAFPRLPGPSNDGYGVDRDAFGRPCAWSETFLSHPGQGTQGRVLAHMRPHAPPSSPNGYSFVELHGGGRTGPSQLLGVSAPVANGRVGDRFSAMEAENRELREQLRALRVAAGLEEAPPPPKPMPVPAPEKLTYDEAFERWWQECVDRIRSPKLVEGGSTVMATGRELNVSYQPMPMPAPPRREDYDGE